MSTFEEIVSDAKARYAQMNPYDEGDQQTYAAEQAVRAAGISRENRAFAVRQVLAAWGKQAATEPAVTPATEAPVQMTAREKRNAQRAKRQAEIDAANAAARAAFTPEQIAEEADRKSVIDAACARHEAELRERAEKDAAIDAVVLAVRRNHPEWVEEVQDKGNTWEQARLRNSSVKVIGRIISRSVSVTGHNTDGDETHYATGEVKKSVSWELCKKWQDLSVETLEKLLKRVSREQTGKTRKTYEESNLV